MGMVVVTLRVPFRGHGKWTRYAGAPVPATLAAIFALAILPAKFAPAQYPYRVIYPEQRQVEYRDPSPLPAIPLPPTAAPPTVSAPPTGDTRKRVTS